ncbi:hypothetical protein ACLOJK_025469, partial [Asimina triloba]
MSWREMKTATTFLSDNDAMFKGSVALKPTPATGTRVIEEDVKAALVVQLCNSYSAAHAVLNQQATEE